MKLNSKRTILVGLAFLSICAFWQMYDSIVPLILTKTFHMNETFSGAIMAADNILALFLLPFFGSVSDKSHTKIGKRMPFILFGTGCAIILMNILPLLDNSYAAQPSGFKTASFVIVLGLLLVAMGTYRAPAVALMPDVTPKPLRSRANAIINLMGAVGGVYTLIMIKLLVGKGDRPDYMPLFVSVAALMVISVGILVITISEKKIEAKVAAEIKAYEDSTGLKVETEDTIEEEQLLEAEKNSSDENKGKTVKMQMPPEVKRSMAFLLTSIFLWFTAYNAVTTAFSRYTKVVWHLEGGGFADCLMVATVAAILSYVPIGNLAGRIGRKKTILVGIVLMSICYFAAIFVSQYHGLVNVAFAVIGIGWAAINVNSYPMIVEMSKGSDIGKFTGTYYTFSMAAQILTPILSGFLLENVSYRTLFPYAFVFSVLAFITMAQVRHGDARPDKKKSLLENFDVDD